MTDQTPTCPACLDAPHRGRCVESWCDCFTGPIGDDHTLRGALESYINDEGNHVGGVWGDYGQVVVDTSDLWHYITGTEREWERTSGYAATYNQMREALEAAEARAYREDSDE